MWTSFGIPAWCEGLDEIPSPGPLRRWGAVASWSAEVHRAGLGFWPSQGQDAGYCLAPCQCLFVQAVWLLYPGSSSAGLKLWLAQAGLGWVGSGVGFGFAGLIAGWWVS